LRLSYVRGDAGGRGRWEVLVIAKNAIQNGFGTGGSQRGSERRKAGDAYRGLNWAFIILFQSAGSETIWSCEPADYS